MIKVSMAILFGICMLVPTVPGFTHDPAKSLEELVCGECHTCEYPRGTDVCLKKICPRHDFMDDLEASFGPEIVILDELEELYVPVRFDHGAHAKMVRMTGGCETCHHYTPPKSQHPSCKDCHPAEILHEDIAQPGLRGAYHRNCMGCHADWDKDWACEICHEKKDLGRPGESQICEHSHYQPIELEELILFSVKDEKWGDVPFHHRNHSEMYERDCVECHQQQSCKRCHVQGEVPHPMGEPAETDLHDTCFACHDGQKCGNCHGRDPDDLFKHASTGWALKRYHADLHCRSCHGERGAFMKLEPKCQYCHTEGWDAETFNHRVTGVVLNDVHAEMDCADCHTVGPGQGTSCDACHDDGRTYKRSTGFGG